MFYSTETSKVWLHRIQFNRVNILIYLARCETVWCFVILVLCSKIRLSGVLSVKFSKDCMHIVIGSSAVMSNMTRSDVLVRCYKVPFNAVMPRIEQESPDLLIGQEKEI